MTTEGWNDERRRTAQEIRSWRKIVSWRCVQVIGLGSCLSCALLSGISAIFFSVARVSIRFESDFYF
jgi:hypothetical protein